MVGLNKTLTAMYKNSNKEATKSDTELSSKFFIDKAASSLETNNVRRITVFFTVVTYVV